ncbi:ADP-ribosylation factor-like protein 6 [Trichonephila clavipes]|nr:ADP-ribosylation factor-like protein 6 [Trichonephila clavipes]
MIEIVFWTWNRGRLLDLARPRQPRCVHNCSNFPRNWTSTPHLQEHNSSPSKTSDPDNPYVKELLNRLYEFTDLHHQAVIEPNCNSHYKDTGTRQVFAFPKEDFLRKKWIEAISRKDFAPSKYSKVCELHFSADAIRRYTKAYNEKTGEKICMPLKGFRLQNFAVPTIFTDFPTYLYNSGNPAWECLEQRLQRLENEHLQRSIQASIISKE